MSTSISSILVDCLKRFNGLTCKPELKAYASEVPPDAWADELGRLRVWAANIGAHQTAQSSLDYRLRDASHIRAQTVKLLERLRRTLDDAEELLTGTAEDDEDFSADEDEQTELQQIYKSLIDAIDCLFQLSMIIRRPAQHDRLLGTKKLDATMFEPFDRQHVANKHPNAGSIVVDRLGAAISRRRAALKYRERHHAKLANGIERAFAQPTNRSSAGDSTLLSQTVATEYKETHIDYEETASNSGASQTSYAPSLWESSEKITVPKIPKDATYGKAFECPYCFFIVTVSNRRSWARHVFKDLMPYICVFQDCGAAPNRLFDSRHDWFQHLRTKHMQSFNPGGVDECPLRCGSNVPAVLLERHLARHLEELALFALPRAEVGDEEDSNKSRGSIALAEGAGDEASSTSSEEKMPVTQSPLISDIVETETSNPSIPEELVWEQTHTATEELRRFAEESKLDDETPYVRPEEYQHQLLDDAPQGWDAERKFTDSAVENPAIPSEVARMRAVWRTKADTVVRNLYASREQPLGIRSESLEDIKELIAEGEQLGVNTPSIRLLQTRTDIIDKWRADVKRILTGQDRLKPKEIDLLLQQGRDFRVTMPELISLEKLHAFEERPAVQPQDLRGTQLVREPSPQDRRVYVDNLASDVKWHHLTGFMKQAGEVLFADILLMPNDTLKGSGMVEYASREQARHAVQTLNGKTLMGFQVHVREDTESRYNEPLSGPYRRHLELHQALSGHSSSACSAEDEDASAMTPDDSSKLAGLGVIEKDRLSPERLNRIILDAADPRNNLKPSTDQLLDMQSDSNDDANLDISENKQANLDRAAIEVVDESGVRVDGGSDDEANIVQTIKERSQESDADVSDGNRDVTISPSADLNSSNFAALRGSGTSLEQVGRLWASFHKDWLPRCDQFISSPPSAAGDRLREYQELRDGIVNEIDLRAYAIEQDTTETRSARKRLLHKVNDIMKEVEAAASISNLSQEKIVDAGPRDEEPVKQEFNSGTGNTWANSSTPPVGGPPQPPFANSFPSFGTTLTAEQLNAIERRKQEEQYLAAMQKKNLAQQQLAMEMQMPGVEETQEKRTKGKSAANELDGRSIKFTDAVKRNFSFPFDKCSRWKDMEDLVNKAFIPIKDLTEHVAAGHYDLIGPGDQIIRPQDWDDVIEPGIQITMVMWPVVNLKPGRTATDADYGVDLTTKAPHRRKVPSVASDQESEESEVEQLNLSRDSSYQRQPGTKMQTQHQPQSNFTHGEPRWPEDIRPALTEDESSSILDDNVFESSTPADMYATTTDEHQRTTKEPSLQTRSALAPSGNDPAKEPAEDYAEGTDVLSSEDFGQNREMVSQGELTLSLQGEHNDQEEALAAQAEKQGQQRKEAEQVYDPYQPHVVLPESDGRDEHVRVKQSAIELITGPVGDKLRRLAKQNGARVHLPLTEGLQLPGDLQRSIKISGRDTARKAIREEILRIAHDQEPRKVDPGPKKSRPTHELPSIREDRIPRVEDEDVALASEHSSELSPYLVRRDGQAVPFRGSVDQYPLIIDSYEAPPKVERESRPYQPTSPPEVEQAPSHRGDHRRAKSQEGLPAALSAEKFPEWPRPAGKASNKGGTNTRIMDFAKEVDSIRAPRDDELSVMEHFAKHARTCDHCRDPYAAWKNDTPMCSRGLSYARDVASYLYARGGRPYSIIDRQNGDRVQVQVPYGCEAVTLLIKAIERGMKTTPRVIIDNARRPESLVYEGKSSLFPQDVEEESRRQQYEREPVVIVAEPGQRYKIKRDR